MDSVAFPEPAQVELKVTVTGVVAGVTVAVMLVVPYADSGLVPKVREVKLTPATGAEALTAKPMEVDTAVPATEAFALTVEAPLAVELAAFRLMVATPDASVRAVPVAGPRVATVVSALKVTTTLGTGAPVALNTVALTAAGVLVVAAPVVGSARAMAMLGAPVTVAPVPVPVVGGNPLPPQLANKAVIAANIKAVKDLG